MKELMVVIRVLLVFSLYLLGFSAEEGATMKL